MRSDSGDADPGPIRDAGRRRRVLRNAAAVVAAAAVIGLALWIIYGIGIDTIVEKIQNLPTALVVTLVFLLPALEASAFVGVVFPGEVAVLVGGVAASNGKVPLAAVIVAACAGAVIGDQVGYVVGREWGVQILGRLPDRLVDADRIDRTQDFVRRAGAKGVIIGRWTAALRAFIPGLAGMSRMHYPRFLAANIVGGVGWGVACAVLGYVAGAHFHTIEKAMGNASSVLLALIVLGLLARHFWHGRRNGAGSQETLERRLEDRLAGPEPEPAADPGPGPAVSPPSDNGDAPADAGLGASASTSPNGAGPTGTNGTRATEPGTGDPEAGETRFPETRAPETGAGEIGAAEAGADPVTRRADPGPVAGNGAPRLAGGPPAR